jgi:hypothetical protein
MKKLSLLSFVFMAFLLMTSNIAAQSKIRVRFAKGTTSATLKGVVKGYNYIDYIIGAKSGQTMSVNLKASNAACSFFMYYSDLKEINEASDVQETTRNVDVDDNYIVRVLLPRSAARRKESATFTLRVSIE